MLVYQFIASLKDQAASSLLIETSDKSISPQSVSQVSDQPLPIELPNKRTVWCKWPIKDLDTDTEHRETFGMSTSYC